MKLFFNIICCLAGLAVVTTTVCLAADSSPSETETKTVDRIVPDHEIKYVEPLSPVWKDNWDLARSLYREEKFPEALVQYEILLNQKDNIDEARWEYASILIYLKRWDLAKVELEKLLATDPENISYKISMARVSLETDNIGNALTLYTSLAEQPLSDLEKALVLNGLIEVHEALGNEVQAGQILNQLIVLKPDDLSLQIKQAAFELQLDNVDQAGVLCKKLAQKKPDDVEVLALCALVELKQNNTDNASVYWQKVIALEPDNGDAHHHLYTYYFENGNWGMSLKHLQHLLKNEPDHVGYLQHAAELNLLLDRVDRALKYFDYALAVDPANAEIIAAKKEAQKKLASDLLALVENDGGKRLWKDLVKVTPDCTGVYREIASLLREQGKLSELINVLSLLNEQKPEDQQIYEELVSLLKQKGRVEELAILKGSRDNFNKPENK